MARMKVPLRYITDKKSRREAYRTRSQGLMKKAGEVATLCDIKACIIIFPEGELSVPQVYPSFHEAMPILNRFRKLEGNDRFLKTVDQVSFLEKRKCKLQNEALRYGREHEEREIRILLHRVLLQGSAGLSMEEIAKVGLKMGVLLKSISDRITKICGFPPVYEPSQSQVQAPTPHFTGGMHTIGAQAPTSHFTGGMHTTIASQAPTPHFTGGMHTIAAQAPTPHFTGGMHTIGAQAPTPHFTGGMHTIGAQASTPHFTGGMNTIGAQAATPHFTGGMHTIGAQAPTPHFTGGMNTIGAQTPTPHFTGGMNTIAAQAPTPHFTGGMHTTGSQVPAPQFTSSMHTTGSQPPPQHNEAWLELMRSGGGDLGALVCSGFNTGATTSAIAAAGPNGDEVMQPFNAAFGGP